MSRATAVVLFTHPGRLHRAARPNRRGREKAAHWTEPELVANIAFTEWTHDGQLRHPRYKGLRPDNDP